eukprot:907595_1
MSTPYVGTVNEEQKTSLEPGRWKSVRRQEDSPNRIDLYVSNLEPNTEYSIRSTNKLKSFGPNEYHLVTSNKIGDVYDDNFKVGWNDKGHFWILDKSDDEDGMYIGSVSGYRSKRRETLRAELKVGLDSRSFNEEFVAIPDHSGLFKLIDEHYGRVGNILHDEVLEMIQQNMQYRHMELKIRVRRGEKLEFRLKNG